MNKWMVQIREDFVGGEITGRVGPFETEAEADVYVSEIQPRMPGARFLIAQLDSPASLKEALCST